MTETSGIVVARLLTVVLETLYTDASRFKVKPFEQRLRQGEVV